MMHEGSWRKLSLEKGKVGGGPPPAKGGNRKGRSAFLEDKSEREACSF